MTTYNPYFFGHSSPDFIPANPPAARVTLDPNKRDSVLHPRETPSQWRALKPRWSFSHSTGELASPYMMAEVDGREINRVLALAGERHVNQVKTICLWIANECMNPDDDSDSPYLTLLHYLFERADHREGEAPQMCWVGPAAKWVA
jgi:hypothetical protein